MRTPPPDSLILEASHAMSDAVKAMKGVTASGLIQQHVWLLPIRGLAWGLLGLHLL